MESTAGAAALAEAPARLEIIDLDHLAHMTLGDRSLELEVLALFDRQAAVLLAHMRTCTPAAAAGFAHTLKGSARGIGAWRIAAAAEAVERRAAGPHPDELADAVNMLAAAVEEAKAAIADRLSPETAL